MASHEIQLLRGVKRRRKTGQLYCEVRISGGKFCTTKIGSIEEGGLCYDIAKRYDESSTEGAPGSERGKRRASTPKLNYPEYSRTLQLEPLPSNLDNKRNKEKAMELILKQAQAAAQKLLLPSSQAVRKQGELALMRRGMLQRHSAQVVGSQITRNQSLPKQNVQDTSLHLRKFRMVQKIFEELSECSKLCIRGYDLKVAERTDLESKVGNVNKVSGIIRLSKSSPDKFHEYIASIKELISRYETLISFSPDELEQEYKSEESKCEKLRKKLEEHNLKFIDVSLMDDGNDQKTGCRRANEKERFPEVVEEPQVQCSWPVEKVTGSLVHDMPCDEVNIPRPLDVRMGTSLPLAPNDSSSRNVYSNEDMWMYFNSLKAASSQTGCPREDEDERPAAKPGSDDIIDHDFDFVAYEAAPCVQHGIVFCFCGGRISSGAGRGTTTAAHT